MLRQYVDETDLKIISMLSKDCRESFMSIGSAVGMTSKSVKARVDTMLSTGVIEEFVVKVNPVALGYGLSCMLIVREHTENTNDIVNRLNLLGDVSSHTKCLGGISAFCLAIKEGNEDKLKLLFDSLKLATVHIMFTSKLSSSSSRSDLRNKDELSDTDLRVITVILFSQDIFTANSILKKVESFNGVKRVELFIITETTNYHEWVLREIDRRLIAKSTRPIQQVEPVLEIIS